MNFEAPIPGQSLTGSPGKYAWERPPEVTDPEEALMMHLDRLSTRDKIEDVLDMLELGVDVRTLTEGILRSAVAEGVHTIDISMLIAPVVHEFIKDTAERSGIDFEEGLEDKEEKKRRAPVINAKSAREAMKFLKSKEGALPDDKLDSLGFGKEEPAPMDEQEDMPMMGKPVREEMGAEPMGLMSRGPK